MLQPPTIYIARHCSTAWNVQGLLQGRTDIPLSEEGCAEACQNVQLLRPLGVAEIFTSTRKRAVQTASIYGGSLGVPHHLSAKFDELDHGDWEGRRFDDLCSDRSSGFLQWLQDPAGSSIPGSREMAQSAQKRMMEGIRQIACACHQPVLVISHKHSIALFICALQKHPLSAFRDMIDESTEPRKLAEHALVSLITEGEG